MSGRQGTPPLEMLPHSPMLGVHGRSTAPVQSLRNLPSTNEEVGRFADAAHVLLTTTERQLVDDVDDEGMVAAERIRSVRYLGSAE